MPRPARAFPPALAAFAALLGCAGAPPPVAAPPAASFPAAPPAPPPAASVPAAPPADCTPGDGCDGHELLASLDETQGGVLAALSTGASTEKAAGGHAAPRDAICSDGAGCAGIGRDYEMGQSGRAKDPAAALAYYLKACDFGEKTGCNNYGYMTLNGIGTTAEATRGLAYLEKACELGSGPGCHNLGYAYEHAQGVEKDMTVAVELFRKSCSLGQASGCRALGLCYHHGLGLAQDRTQAIAYLRIGCAGGDATGCETLRELGAAP